MVKILYFQEDLVHTKAWAYDIKIIPATILIPKIVFASIIPWLKMCKTRAIKSKKVKNIAGNDKKVVQKMFWKLHDMIMTAA